ncbi:hypothetical protein SPBRAN_1281 [uncultured Candidatus Thioglobus sp.]|nr:hypothetical protein SPBRAN_1281 [uncultured Candidatus Thioglobus sp.]
MHTKMTIFDAWNGYHSVALAEQDHHYTTFITPWGRYRYCSPPQGYIASGDAYTARYNALVANVVSKTKCIDDALLWSDNITGAFHQATEWLHICAMNGITLNPRKFRFAEDTVEFAGFTVTPTEVRPADKYLQSITESLSNPSKHHRRTCLVWPCEPGFLHLCNDCFNAPIPFYYHSSLERSGKEKRCSLV